MTEITEASTARERHGRGTTGHENGQEEEEVGLTMKKKEEG